jgi:hypothetical protein
MTTRREWRNIGRKIFEDFQDKCEWKDYKTVEIDGRSCKVQVSGRLHKLNEYVWDGRCECGGIVGSSRHKNNKDEAAQSAIDDVLSKITKPV